MSDFSTLNELVHAAETIEHEPAPAEQQRTWLPETPVMPHFGNQADLADGLRPDEPGPLESSENPAATEVATSDTAEGAMLDWGRHCDPGDQSWSAIVNRAQDKEPQDPVDVIRACLGMPNVNLGPVAALGRKNVFNDFMKGRLVSLLGMGLSLRQAGAALSVSHVAISKELKRNPDLAEQVSKARLQAQIEPLLAILRASRNSWRAATWLVKYLDKQAAMREESEEE